jgi:hypothetical protein
LAEVKYLTPVQFWEHLDGFLSMKTIYRMLNGGSFPTAIQPSGHNGKWMIPEDAADVLRGAVSADA